MKQLLLIMMVGLTVGLGDEESPGTPDQAFTLVGRVTDASTGEPVRGARVVLQNEAVGVLSREDGTFHMHSAWRVDPITITVVEECYHTVEIEIGKNPYAKVRRIEIGLPVNYEKNVPNSIPLGGCRPG